MHVRLAVCALFCLAANLPAQVATGTIVGVVQDPTGAVIANAQITITQLATTDVRKTASNERGEFSLPYVHIGSYAVTFEAAGFKKRR